MTRIQRLPEDLVARIAAGEVVERPASVLKELIENSLDAGATAVSVAIEGAGRTLLRVSDNGCGMTMPEARLALERHATSKISSFDDLETVSTFGFRGEALPSVAAVSRLTLLTRAREEDAGWEVVVDGGRVASEGPVAREPGTTIAVRDLFFNTPARFKFLKADATERANAIRVVEEAAFAAPEVAFTLTVETAKPVVFPSAAGPAALRQRVVQALGARWEKGLIPISAEAGPHLAVHGYVSHPGHHQATPRHQFLFVNRRPVWNRRVSRAIYDGFLSQLPSGRHPAWVLFLDVNPRAVDVNVHPAKREVKLTFEAEVYGLVRGAVAVALEKVEPLPGVAVLPEGVGAGTGARETLFSGALRPGGAPSNPPAVAREAAGRLYEPLIDAASCGMTAGMIQVGESNAAAVGVGALEAAGVAPALFTGQSVRAIAQVRNLFIIGETETELIMIDQHAAAEKVLYETILRNIGAAAPEVQMLLVPAMWEVSFSAAEGIAANIPAMRDIGFLVEPFGGNAFVVKGYPRALGERFDLDSLLDAAADELLGSEDRRGGSERNFAHRMAALMACKAAVKAGDTLSLSECQRLFDDWLRCTSPLNCPHGRPAVLRIPFEDLLRRFDR